MTVIRQSQKQSDISAHKLKREKLLASDYNTLSRYDVKVLVQQFAGGEPSLMGHILLASLFTGRSIDNLLDPKVKTQTFEDLEFGTLYSTLEFPDWRENLSIGKSDICVSLPPFVFLPGRMIQLIATASRLDSEQISDEAERLLSELNDENRTRLTLIRIKNYLRMQSAKYGLSQAEVNFISNTPLRAHGGNSYLCTSAKDLSSKHYTYINALLSIANRPPIDIKPILEHRMADVPMGSNFSVPATAFRSAIKELKHSINKERQRLHSGYGDRWRLFNCFTYYTLIVMNMCTGHRPSRNYYDALNKLDLSRRAVFIKDKANREEPGRILPLNALAAEQLKHYLYYLKKFIDSIQYLQPDEAEVLRRALNGEENLFYLYSKGRLKTFNNSVLRDVDIPKVEAKNNWNRHWIKSALESRADIKPAAVDSFLGHENLLDETFSRFSTLNTSDLRDVADALEEEASNLRVEPLEVLL
jgi:hypothetical protein